MSTPARRVMTGLTGAAAMIAVVTVVSRLLGFGRWLVLEATVGHGAVSGAYNAANTLPNVLFEVAAGGALAGALIPLLAGPLARRMRDEVDTIASAMLGWTLAVLVPLALVLALFAGPIAGLLTDGTGPERDLIARFLAVFALQLPFYGITVVLSGVLQAQRRFFWPAFAPVISTLVVMASYVMYGVVQGPVAGADDLAQLSGPAFAWLAWGTTAGVLALGLPLFVPVARSGVRWRPTLRFPPGVARRARGLAVAGVGALVAQQVAVFVLLRLSLTSGSAGTNTVYLYTQAVYFLPYAVLAVPLATSTFPRLAARAAAHDEAGFRAMAAATTRGVLVVAAIGAAGLVAVAPAVATLFGNIGAGSSTGGGDPALVDAMSPALTCMAIGVVGYALVFHVSRALYALERGRAAVVATSIGWGAVVVAALVLTRVLVPGAPDGPRTLVALCAATSIGMVVGGAALLVALHRAAGPGALDGLARTVGVALAGGVVAALLGRAATAVTLDVVGHASLTAVAAGVGGALVAALVGTLALFGLDRGTVTGIVRIERTAVAP